MPESNKIVILSIDGGGIRGIIPATILKVIEEKLQQKLNDQNARLADCVDLAGGTSTGSILVGGMLTPDPHYTMSDLLDLYMKEGPEIFKTNIFNQLIGGIFDEKYPAEHIEKVLEKYFGQLKLNELEKPCLITAYDIFHRKSVFFTSHEANSESKNFKVTDVLRASTAAPTYFETAAVTSELGATYPLIDGGVFANNPALCAYAEARKMVFPAKQLAKPTAKDMIIISIGTGTAKEQFPYDKAKDWGAIGWIRPLIEIMMSGNAETVDYQLRQIYDTLGPEDSSCYYRLQVDLREVEVDPAMDNAHPENLEKLNQAGLKFAADHENSLDDIVELLIRHRIGPDIVS
ncbi:MAG: patatin-like phospholipase family protein [Candidatus Cyclobacteriaceae bacterium M3_2C_046]